jgi:hypothetical protein
MKRTLTLCFAFILVLGFAGCSGTTTFQRGSMSITLPSEFEEINRPDYTVCYNSAEVTVFVLRETVADTTLAEYADGVRSANAWLSPDPIETVDGLTTMEYVYENIPAQMTICYFATMFQDSSGDFWLIQFCCEDYFYEQYRPQFIEWAKTVCFDSK